jgi:hypothetical protein
MSGLLIILAAVLFVAAVAAFIVWWYVRRRRKAGRGDEWWQGVERLSWICTLICSPLALVSGIMIPVATLPASPPNNPIVTDSSPRKSPDAVAPSGGLKVVVTGDDFSLGPPSKCPGPETDKIDLDTGERGYGKVVQDLGLDCQPDDGGRTDVIIEGVEIHSFGDGDKSIALLSAESGSGHASCVTALADNSRRVARVPLRGLGQGSRLCVETDEGRIALITIKAVSAGPVLTIGYTTWETD